MGYLLTFIIGVLVGLIVAFTYTVTTSSGVLRIDKSDKYDEPYLFLELETPVSEIEKKHVVKLVVRAENYLSHK